jgi:hypothetical protein
MFLQLARIVPGGANQVLTAYRPSQLSEFLEVFWNTQRDGRRQAALNVPAANHMLMARTAADVLDPLAPAVAVPPQAPAQVTWRHAVYAALLEQTNVTEVFGRILAEWLQGERLPRPLQPAQRWLHVTEQLFFGSSWSYSIRSVTSSLRPDPAAVRRNMYWRLFGWEIQGDDGRSLPYFKSAIANQDFSSTLESLLVEGWRGYINLTNAGSPNETDNNAIDFLIERLRDMLQARRYQGALSREEFVAVAMMSWFHLSLSGNNAIINNLGAQGLQRPADRLQRLGEMVGVRVHSRSDAFFRLAIPLSNFLIDIESGAVNAANLYAGVYQPVMLEILTQWSVATGRNLKDPGLRKPVDRLLRQQNLASHSLPSIATAVAVR